MLTNLSFQPPTKTESVSTDMTKDKPSIPSQELLKEVIVTYECNNKFKKRKNNTAAMFQSYVPFVLGVDTF